MRAQPAISPGGANENLATKVNRTGHLTAPLRVMTYQGFDDLPDHYADLLDEMAEVNFSCSRAWFNVFARTALQDGATLRLYGVESAEPPAQAHALLVAQTPAARRGSVLRRRHIGQRTLSGLTGYQTYLYAPLVRDRDPRHDEIFDCLALHLRSERPRWELVEFSAMDADARSYRSLMSALGRAGYIVRSYPHFQSVFQPTSKLNYADYLGCLPQSARKQLRDYERKERQLQREFDYRLTLSHSDRGLDRALSDFANVLEASWKEPDHHPAFLPACIRAAAHAGALRLMLIYLDDRPAATQLVFLAGKRAVFFRTAYDPQYAKRSVGGIVKLRMIEHLLNADQVDELDLGRDREAYKRYFATNARMRRGILAIDCRTFGGMRGLAEQLPFELRDWFGKVSRPLRPGLEAGRHGSIASRRGS